MMAALLPPLGGLLLLVGYTLADRSFAILNLSQWLHAPIFITEAVLAPVLARTAYQTYRQRDFAALELSWRSPWLGFYLVGALNTINGLLVNPLYGVLRDAAIVYYGIIAQITLCYVKKPSHVRVVFFTVFGAIILRALLQFLSPVFTYGSSAELYAGFVILASYCAYSQWSRFRTSILILTGLLLSIMASIEIRTAWLSFFLAWVCMGGLLVALKMGLKRYAVLCATMAVSIVLTAVYHRTFNRPHYELIKSEWKTFFMGVKSPNLMTRVAMWEDAVEEILPPLAPVFQSLDRRSLNPFLYGTAEAPKKIALKSAAAYKSGDRARTATSVIGEFDSPPAPSSPWLQRLSQSRIRRTLFGVPFGERFIPLRIATVHRTDHYDPHNSIIAIFYRTGIVGFLIFFWLLGRELQAAYRVARTTRWLEQKEMILACIVCLIYHMGYSMTDVTLENPFKGSFFWLLLGLLIAVRRMSPPAPLQKR